MTNGSTAEGTPAPFDGETAEAYEKRLSLFFQVNTAIVMAEAVSKSESLTELVDLIEQYSAAKDQSKFLATREKELKGILDDYVTRLGEVDGKGHIVLDAPPNRAGVIEIVKQRKVSKSEDTETVERILKEKGLWDQCTETITITNVNQDAVMACVFKEELTEDEVDLMYPSTITYAFLVKK